MRSCRRPAVRPGPEPERSAGARDEHTVERFSQELAELNGLVLRMGGLVEQQIARAVMSLADHDIEIARDVIARDHVVDFLDVQADERIVNLLALRQPMGRDPARHHVARQGGHSRNIAE